MPFVQKKSIAERLASVVRKTESGCLEFVGKSRSHNGYGLISVGGRQQRAHRVAWEEKFGPIPDGLCVCHRCDNRLCVNTDHMFLGSNDENVVDRCAKGRSAAGERHGMRLHPDRNHFAKLSESDVKQIRAALSVGEDVAGLAWRFMVDVSTINRIRSGSAWKAVA